VPEKPIADRSEGKEERPQPRTQFHDPGRAKAELQRRERQNEPQRLRQAGDGHEKRDLGRRESEAPKADFCKIKDGNNYRSPKGQLRQSRKAGNTKGSEEKSKNLVG